MNLFMQFNWQLREYRTTIVNNLLKIVQQTNHEAPAAQLFNEADPHAKGPNFRSAYLNVVPKLSVNDINLFSTTGLSTTFDSGDGDQQHPTKGNYTAQFQQSPNFAASIQQKLGSIGSTLTAAQIVERSQALSCQGCHQMSNGKNLGGGLIWPSSLGFVHVSEALRETAPDGTVRFQVSPALNNVFLPRRKAVLEAFLNGA